jgi:protein gp37
VFCASLADVFDNQVDPDWRQDLYELIRLTPELDWLVLTKRPENCEKMLPFDWLDGFPNVWLGTTAENQTYYDRRWRVLRHVPARAHFISYEPALGPLDIECGEDRLPDWIICGGETGNGARYMKPRWARNLRDQCKGLGVKFFLKQMTRQEEIPRDLFVREFPKISNRLKAG